MYFKASWRICRNVSNRKLLIYKWLSQFFWFSVMLFSRSQLRTWRKKWFWVCGHEEGSVHSHLVSAWVQIPKYLVHFSFNPFLGKYIGTGFWKFCYTSSCSQKSTLLPVFTNWKKFEEDFSFYGKRWKVKIVFRVCSAPNWYGGSVHPELPRPCQALSGDHVQPAGIKPQQYVTVEHEMFSL